MKLRGIGAVATLALAALAVESAHAQPQTVPNWTGFYLGADFGAGAWFGKRTTPTSDFSILFSDTGGSSILASIHGGFDYQFMPRALFGVKVEGTWSDMTSSTAASIPGGTFISFVTRADVGVALLARAGVLATPSSLLYVTGGYAGQNFRTTGTLMFPPVGTSFTSDSWYNGWTVGGGFETLLRGGWSAQLEYRYSQFETKTESKFNQAVNWTLQPALHTARVGLSYRFGGGHDAAADEPAAAGRRDWTGFYGGIAGGAGVLQNKLNLRLADSSFVADGGGQNFLGAVFIGADYQVSDQFVVGLLGDLTWPGIESVMNAGAGAQLVTRANMAWTIAGRVGWLVTPQALIYALAGYTNESFSFTTYDGSGTLQQSLSGENRLGGFTVGPGIEFMIARNVFARLEYRYSQFETRSLSFPSPFSASMQPSTHTARAGLAYKFN
jgi:outer membrane immunogenic protein